MKLPAARKNQPPVNLPVNLVGLPDDGPAFLNLIAEQMGTKELAYAMQVSKQYMSLVLKGEKPDPLSRARRICAIARAAKKSHLIAPILLYIAGDDFNGMVLDNDQAEIVRQFAALVNGKKEGQ